MRAGLDEVTEVYGPEAEADVGENLARKVEQAAAPDTPGGAPGTSMTPLRLAPLRLCAATILVIIKRVIVVVPVQCFHKLDQRLLKRLAQRYRPLPTVRQEVAGGAIANLEERLQHSPRV